MPTRHQRQRTRGWRTPHDPQGRPAVYVGRGTRYGNPWAIVQTNTGTGWAVQWAGHAQQHKPLGINDHIPANDRRDAHTLAVELYATWLHAHPALEDRAHTELAGRDLLCWCPVALPCHADVLLELAATEEARP